MKLRTNKNSIRIRISQSELKQFDQEGNLSECVRLSPRTCDSLEYSLVQYGGDNIALSFYDRHIRIMVPESVARTWIDSELVGFDGHLANGTEKGLYVLVEKDFKCLDDRPFEDETDNFPNPNIACK